MAHDVFNDWLSGSPLNVDKHILLVLAEKDGARDNILSQLREICSDHYIIKDVKLKRLAELGAQKTAVLLRAHLPETKKARSGELGEILATELAERRLGYRVPIRRLRWKDGRNMALRGDDIVAISEDNKGLLSFLKGESKSRAALSSTVVSEAAEALDRDRGRPTRHSVLFVADRLREDGQDDLAKKLEEAVIQSFRSSAIEHLLFTVSGNDPEHQLTEHLNACKSRRRRRAVGVQIEDHGKFVTALFSKM
jgi:hypothetical protein